MKNIHIIILSFVFFLLSSCTSLIYQPDKYLYGHPDRVNTKFEFISLNSVDGTKLSGWRLFSKNKNPKNLVVYFHGNAQNLSSHFMNLVWLTEHDYDVIIFDYRGYGFSEGEPNPQGVSEDGLTFLNYGYDVFKKDGFKKFIVYTQSLGGAIALRSLEGFNHRDKVSLLVLDSTFLSPRLVARDKTNRLFQYLVSNDFTANPELKHLTNIPVLSIHSTEDFVIPYYLGQDLFKKVPNTKKDFWTFHAKGHGDVFFVEDLKYRTQFRQYIDKLP